MAAQLHASTAFSTRLQHAKTIEATTLRYKEPCRRKRRARVFTDAAQTAGCSGRDMYQNRLQVAWRGSSTGGYRPPLGMGGGGVAVTTATVELQVLFLLFCLFFSPFSAGLFSARLRPRPGLPNEPVSMLLRMRPQTEMILCNTWFSRDDHVSPAGSS